VGIRVRSPRAPQAVPAHRLLRKRRGLGRDGGEPQPVILLSLESARGALRRGERSRGDRPAHGDVRAQRLACKIGDHEPPDGGRMDDRAGPRRGMVGGRPASPRRWPDVDAISLRRPESSSNSRRANRQSGSIGTMCISSMPI
jgi:hypothetical protein